MKVNQPLTLFKNLNLSNLQPINFNYPNVILTTTLLKTSARLALEK